jgi:radical SAM protein with 4Fe4S-binding SPASM domain
LINNELEISDLIGILENFIKQIKIWDLPKDAVRISFTGGEPFIKKGFWKLLQKCYQNRDKFRYGILTNGTFLDEKIAEKLKKLKVSYVQISLEGTKKTNDYLRGKGVFEKGIKGIRLLKNKGIEANLSMTVSKVNLKDVPAMIKLCRKLNVSLGIRRLIPSGHGQVLKKFILIPQEVKSFWHYVQKMRQNYGDRVGLGCEDGMMVQDFPSYIPGYCTAGYLSLTILPNADVYPCRRLPILVGNLLKESFESIYNNSKPLKKLRNLNNINDVCFSCPYREKCQGGAKCLAFSYFNDIAAPDPQCWRLFKKLTDPKLKWKNSSQQRPERLNFKWAERNNS